MKPNFALKLSFEGIGLLHRSTAGWARVGEVPLDVPDLPEALNLLKKTAAQITPEPLTVKLLLPSEQIKYLQLTKPDGPTSEYETAVLAALDGATPYTLEELAYCWAESGADLVVAAVARETLLEAETFASDNGFEPIYFTAQPSAGSYVGEPFFGSCKSIDADIERDLEAVVVSGVARIPEAATAPPEDVLPATSAPKPEVQPPQASSPSFSTRREAEGKEAVAPSLSGVTRHEPSAVAPSIPLLPEDEANAAPPPPQPLPDLTAAAREEMAFVSQRNPDGSPELNAPATQPANTTPVAPAPRPLPTPPPNLVPPTENERQRLTVFGARKKEKVPQKQKVMGKPRFLGLILTAVLLVFLLGVAAWASIFVGEGLSRFLGKDPERIVLAPSDLDETEIEGDEAMVLEPQLELAALDTGEETHATDLSRVMPLPIPEISLQEAQEKYAVTGIWVLAPAAPTVPPLQDSDDLYIASIDPVISAQDAIALPALTLEQADGTLGRQTNPAAQGLSFALDARGLVRATKEGAISPDGHLVFAGKPPYFPTDLPDRKEALEGAVEVPDLRAAMRPKARPEGLAEANERANLGGFSRTELASIRPKMRPPSAREIAAAEPQPTPTPNASAALEQAIEEAVAQAVPPTPGAVVIKLPEANARDLDPNATPQAVARSVKPKDRPNNFDRIVKRAEKNQQQEEVTQVAAVAPRTVAPSIPSRASVAKQATVRNAINLKRVNLIGVYGKPASRRALVRLSNGRYKKVAVGDRIDGGRVSAIGETELIYQKNGRGVTLKMPKG